METHITGLVALSFVWSDGFKHAEIDSRCVWGSSCQNVHGKLPWGCLEHEAQILLLLWRGCGWLLCRWPDPEPASVLPFSEITQF